MATKTFEDTLITDGFDGAEDDVAPNATGIDNLGTLIADGSDGEGTPAIETTTFRGNLTIEDGRPHLESGGIRVSITTSSSDEAAPGEEEDQRAFSALAGRSVELRGVQIEATIFEAE
ncbi:MAG TPA: hypothetical protein VMU84_02370, partial [Thermoanaerobaculia bacterium]|nr:hypothetical protein [Thermoanaerobaculia bacterium]